MIVNGQTETFQDRDDFFTAHIERLCVFIDAQFIFIVLAVLLFSQYTPPP